MWKLTNALLLIVYGLGSPWDLVGPADADSNAAILQDNAYKLTGFKLVAVGKRCAADQMFLGTNYDLWACRRLCQSKDCVIFVYHGYLSRPRCELYNFCNDLLDQSEALYYIKDPYSECTPGFCLNGGTCIQGTTSYSCNCLPGYNGTNCQEDFNYCESSLCESGTCLADNTGYRCSCYEGYEGINCETGINECESQPCKHGTCLDDTNGYTCDCTGTGYVGINCETEINECQSQPCEHGACVDGTNGYICSCTGTGYVGIICETDINECNSQPCEHGACVDDTNGYMCDCTGTGYIGINCETEINECESQPCEHGTCVDDANGYTCNCTGTYYVGINCETGMVGFTASAASVISYSEDQVVKFTSLRENSDDYDPTTGRFTCPISGVYYVIVSLRKNNLHPLYIDVYQSDKRIIRVHEDSTQLPGNTVSNAALVYCLHGKYIEMRGFGSGEVYGEESISYSTFTVMKLNQNAEDSACIDVGYSGCHAESSHQYSDAELLQYETPVYDVGNAFSGGEFTCPVTGLYFTSASIKAIDGNFWISAYISTAYDFKYEVLGVIVVDNPNFNIGLVYCNEGEIINGKMVSSSGHASLYGGAPVTTLTVFLVQETDQIESFTGFSKTINNKVPQMTFNNETTLRFTKNIIDNIEVNLEEYKCPKTGTYFFAVTIAMIFHQTNHTLQIDLKHDEDVVFRLKEEYANNYNMLSNSALVRCRKGEVVKVTAVGPGRISTYDYASTFTGFMVFEN